MSGPDRQRVPARRAGRDQVHRRRRSGGDLRHGGPGGVAGVGGGVHLGHLRVSHRLHQGGYDDEDQLT